MPHESVLVSLPQLVDLALNAPEVGAVNFNVLHSLLHVLIQQVDLLETKVEFKGTSGNRIQSILYGTTRVEPSVNLTEYVVISGQEPKKVISKKDRYKKFLSEKGSADEIFVEREVRVVDHGEDTLATPEKDQQVETIVVVETKDNASQVAIGPVLSNSRITKLEEEIHHLKEEIKHLKHLPDNQDLLKATRSTSNTPVVEMVQILTLTKRIEAAEEAVEKLASLLEDLAKEHVPVKKSSTSLEKKRSSTGYSFTAVLNDRVSKLEERVQVLEEQPSCTNDSIENLEPRLASIEEKLRDYTEYIATSSNVFDEQAKILQNQITDLEKDIGELIERMNTSMPAGDSNATADGCSELYKKIVSLEEQFEKFTKMVASHLEDQEDHHATLDVLIEQIELLKTVKADREYINDALADKADACAVNRKVSNEQFQATYEDLSLSLEKTITKLMTQEKMWQQALLDIQNEIESKLDKMELAPLRDFVHNKLKMLQEKLKSLSSLRTDPEAAGARSKILRNLKCISCDAEVIMRKQVDTSLYPPPAPLPSTKTLGPYLSYELDQLRKQKQCSPYGRNLNHFENAVSRDDAEKKSHICNRYCGGSHTTTTAQQRVPKIGNFLQQWANNEGLVINTTIKGVDGHLYKSRDHKEVQQVQCISKGVQVEKTLVVTGDILSERASAKSMDDHKTTLPAIRTKAR